MKIKLILFLLFLFATTMSFAQDLDEIKKYSEELKVTKQDSVRARLNLKISKSYFNYDNKKSLEYCLKAMNYSKKCSCEKIEGNSHYLAGMIYEILGKKEKSLEHFHKGISIFTKLGDKIKIADGNTYLGTYHYGIGNYKKAIDYYENSLHDYEILNDKIGQSDALNNLGATYLTLKDFDKSIYFIKISLKICEELKDENKIAISYVNLGNIHYEKKNYDDALEEYSLALPILRKLNDESTTGMCLINIGVIYKMKNQASKASKYYKEAQQIFERLENVEMLSILYKNYSFSLAEEGKYAEANKLLEMKVALDDSLNNKYLMEQITEMSEKYEADKKQQEIKLLTNEKKNAYQKNKIQKLENENQKAELEKSNTILYFSTGGLILLIAFAIVLLNRFRMKNKINRQLTEQKAEILSSKLIIEQKNKDIIDSIAYAKKIQDAILHEENKILKSLQNHFVIFKPKDIVSGDFYWTLEKNNYLYVAVADCTGHGVPGAFMSMLGIAFLNEITKGEQLKSPATILDELREKVIRELGQSGSIGENRDGMDISLIKMNQKTNHLEFAGANNSLLIVRENKIIQLNADIQPIGYQSQQHSFTNQEIEILNGDMIYLFSDGYADQFGGVDSNKNAKEKKFKISRFKEMIISISNNSTDEQRKIVESTYDNWKGNTEQIDDVCVLAIRK